LKGREERGRRKRRRKKKERYQVKGDMRYSKRKSGRRSKLQHGYLYCLNMKYLQKAICYRLVAN
jgi:hypothetical protein